MENHIDTESLRLSYKPKNIRILFVGESPPASGKFFYRKSNMTSYTAQAFEKAYRTDFVDTIEFLDFFKDKGCYLDDISTTPVDNMKGIERRKVLISYFDDLLNRLREHNPEVIVVVLKRLALYVEIAMHLADITCPYHVLPFPGQGYQRKYISQLSRILEEYMD